MPCVDGLPSKQLEMALAIVPGARRVGIIGKPPRQRELEKAGHALHVALYVREVPTPDDLEGAIAKLANEPVDVAIVLEPTMLVNKRCEIGCFNDGFLVCGYSEHVEAGGLISYGVDLDWCSHRAAEFVAHHRAICQWSFKVETTGSQHFIRLLGAADAICSV